MNLLIAAPGPDGCICQVPSSSSGCCCLPGVPKERQRPLSNTPVPAHSPSAGRSGHGSAPVRSHSILFLLLSGYSVCWHKLKQCSASVGNLRSLILHKHCSTRGELQHDRQSEQELCALCSSIQVTRSSGALLSCQHTRPRLLPALQPQRGLCKASRDVASQLGPGRKFCCSLHRKASVWQPQPTRVRSPAAERQPPGKAAAARHSSGFVVWREGEGLGKGEEGSKGKSVFLTRCRRLSWAIWSPAASRSLKKRKAATLSYRLGGKGLCFSAFRQAPQSSL